MPLRFHCIGGGEKTFTYEEIHGRWLRTRILGDLPKDQSLPPIILVHGYGSRLDAWATVHHRLAKHTQVVAYDMAGFGHSEKTEGKYGVEVHAAELTQLVKTLGLIKPILVGHSYGAGVVMRAALKDPALYAGVIFASAFLFEEQVPPTFKWAKWPGMGELIFGSFYTQVPGEKFLLAFHDRKRMVSAEHLEEVKRVMGQPGAVYAALETVRGMDYASYQADYATLQLPALIIWGSEDRVTPLRFGQRLAEILREAKFKVIEDCGHVPSIEAPLQLSEYILDFAGEKS